MTRIRQRDPQAMQVQQQRANGQRAAASIVASASSQKAVSDEINIVAVGMPPDLTDALAAIDVRLTAIEP